MNVETYGGGSKKIISLHYEAGTDPALLPCPFCGATEALEVANTHTPHYWVECGDCGAQVGAPSSGRHAKTRANHRRSFLAAITAWNTRTPPPEPTR